MNYIIRWTDKQGNKNHKEYTDYKTVVNARNWLIKQGIEEIDIAVSIKK